MAAEGRHPAFAPFAPWLDRLDAGAPASLPTLNAWAREAGLALPDGPSIAFVAAPRRALRALDYELRIARRGEVAVRVGSRHDLFNALAWLRWPRSKAALNAVHVGAVGDAARERRARSRDAATLVDESGLVVACADRELLALWRAHAWRELFWVRREDVVRSLRFAAIGHGLLAKLERPFRAITAKALVVPANAATADAAAAPTTAELDALAAQAIAALTQPSALLPLPVAALPGWDRERLGERLFDDASVFRPRSVR